jgi:cell division protease FtsH
VVGAKLQGIVPDIASITVRKISQGVTVTSFSPFDLRDAVWAKQELARLLAGRAAESLLLNSPPSTGAESDMHRATELAMKAITEWGLDPEWGQLVLSALPPALQCSESHRVHDRINAWLTEAQALAESTLQTHRACVEAVAEALLDKSDLFQEDLAAILKPVAA